MGYLSRKDRRQSVNVNKIIYKPVGMLVGVLGGLAATAAFRKVWELATGDREAPDPTDRNRSWGQILLAATVQGAIFGLVKAAVDRGGATGYKKVTGEWPDD
jgi:predicted metal-dependent enzyme (double-stranded beta helix superfamily)